MLVAYSDGHHFSIGFGHNDPALTAASTITAEDAWALFAKDLIPREDAVNAMLKIPVEQHQFDACVSLYYQGGNKLRVVADLINAGNIPEAMAMQLSFNRDYTHSEFHLGLAKRRLAEVTMFMTADYGDLSKMKLFAADPRTTPFTEVPFPPET